VVPAYSKTHYLKHSDNLPIFQSIVDVKPLQ
jgi:hypothetical protein